MTHNGGMAFVRRHIRLIGALLVVTLVAGVSLAATSALAPATAPLTQSALVGSWVEPNAADPHWSEGFTLREDGTASSINMATLTYRSWVLQGNRLALEAISTGNHTSSTGTEAYTVRAVSDSELDLIDSSGKARTFLRADRPT